MYPEIFRIGSFPINTYGVLLAVGLMLALFAAARLAQNDGLPKQRIYDLGLWTIIGGLFGSKILMFFVEDNVQFFSMDFLRSGGVYYGGFIGGFITLAFLIRRYKLPFWKACDAFAPGVALGQFLVGKVVFQQDAVGEKKRISLGAYILPNSDTKIPACRFTDRMEAICFCIRHNFTNHSRCSQFSVCWFIYIDERNLTVRY